MKIDEAIKTLNDHRELILVFKNPELKAAVQLGIEALKTIRDMRTDSLSASFLPLPGERKK